MIVFHGCFGSFSEYYVGLVLPILLDLSGFICIYGADSTTTWRYSIARCYAPHFFTAVSEDFATGITDDLLRARVRLQYFGMMVLFSLFLFYSSLLLFIYLSLFFYF